jgi:hypothetical protein
MRRAIRGVLLAPILLWALYVVAVQTFLWTPLLRRLINAQGPAVHLEYAFAWSVWPGRVHVRALRLTSQDRGVQWQLDLDRVVTTIVLWQLPRHLFHATAVDAQGLSFALRRRIPRPKITPERLEGLPLIAGFEAAPVAEEGPDYDIPDWQYNLMSVWLENVVAKDVRSIWVDRLRLQGRAEASGAFYIKPVRSVLIAPAEVRGTALLLTHAGAPVVDALHGRFALWLGPFDPRGATPRKLARTVGIEAEGAGSIRGFEFLSRPTHVPLRGGAGPLRFALHVRDGRVLPGTQLAGDVRDASVHDGTLAARARSIAFSLTVPAGDSPAKLRAEARDATLADADGTVGARLEAAETMAEVEAPDLANPDARVASLDLRGGRVEDARMLAAALRLRAARIDGGHGAFALHLAGPPDRLSGWVRASLADLRVHAERLAIRTDAAVDASVGGFDPSRGADLSGTRVRIDGARLIDAGGEEDTAPGWWGRIDLDRAALGLGPDGPLLDSDFTARCRDARPLVGLYVRRADLPGIVSGLFAMEGLAVHGSALLANRRAALRELAATGDGASIRAIYLAENETKRGAALLKVGSISVGVGLGQGGSGVHILGPGDWYATEERQLRTQLPPRSAARARIAPRPPRRSPAKAPRPAGNGQR